MDMINIDDYLRINLYDIVLVLISTFLIVFIAKKYFWNYAREYLEKRQQFVQSQLDESANALAKSNELKAKYETQMANAEAEATEIIVQAKEKAKEEALEIVDKAKSDADAMRKKATQDIEHERYKVKEQIKEEISEVAFLAAQKVVEKSLDEAIHKKYVDDFIQEAGDGTWQA